MPSVTQICNMALAHINRPAIASLDDTPREARECKRLYPILRDVVLGDYPWGFATKWQTLALLSGITYGNWTYAYQVPTDCLAIRKIHNSASEYENIDFETAVSPTLTSKILLTNEPEAQLVYTAAVTDPNVFDLAFVDAFSWRLAADLSIPFKGDVQLHQTCLQTYMILLGRAQQKNSRENFKTPTNSSSFSNARN